MLIYNIIWKLYKWEWRFGELKKFTKVHETIYYKVRIWMKFWIARTWLCRKSHICLLIRGPRNWYCGCLTNSLKRGFHLPLSHYWKSIFLLLKNVYQMNKFRVISNLWPFTAVFHDKYILQTYFSAIEILDTD